MAIDGKRRSRRSDDVQDVELLELSGSPSGGLLSEGGGGVLTVGSVRTHHLHIQNGRSRSARCEVCGVGVEGILAQAEEVEPRVEPEVVSGGGDDEEGSTTPALPDRDRPW